MNKYKKARLSIISLLELEEKKINNLFQILERLAVKEFKIEHQNVDKVYLIKYFENSGDFIKKIELSDKYDLIDMALRRFATWRKLEYKQVNIK